MIKHSIDNRGGRGTPPQPPKGTKSLFFDDKGHIIFKYEDGSIRRAIDPKTLLADLLALRPNLLSTNPERAKAYNLGVADFWTAISDYLGDIYGKD